MTEPFTRERRVEDLPGGPPPPLGERRRLLVGDLVVRRVSFRSVARVAFPVLAIAYVIGVGLGAVAWNVATQAGWSPDPDYPSGITVLETTLVAGVVVVPVAWLVTLGLAALYNGVSKWTGGVEIAIVSPRGGHHRREHH